MHKQHQQFKHSISANHKDGRILEKAVVLALKRLGIKANHNKFDDYGYVRDSGARVDVTFDRHAFECKNLGGYVGESWRKKHIEDRKGWLDYNFDVVSKASYLCLNPASSYPYTVIEVGFKVTQYNFKKAVKRLTKIFRFILNIPLSLDCYNKSSLRCGVNKFLVFGLGFVDIRGSGKPFTTEFLMKSQSESSWKEGNLSQIATSECGYYQPQTSSLYPLSIGDVE